jgi:hypothetical protein
VRPTVYLVFWGANWNTVATKQASVKGEEIDLFTALGDNAGAAATYNQILDQYLGGPGTGKPTFGGFWVDTTNPLTRPLDSGPPVVGVQRPACWDGGHPDEATSTHARAGGAQAP